MLLISSFEQYEWGDGRCECEKNTNIVSGLLLCFFSFCPHQPVVNLILCLFFINKNLFYKNIELCPYITNGTILANFYIFYLY